MQAGVNGNEVPPVPIPNTEVKLIRVDNTWMEASREDKSMPAQAREIHFSGFSCFLCSPLDFFAKLWYTIFNCWGIAKR